MKLLLKHLLILSTLTTPLHSVFAQQLFVENEDDIRAEIKLVHKAEQEAFIQGDCEKVISFFDEDANFDVNGIKSESLNFILDFCKEIPRPYEIGELKNYSLHVFSDTSAQQLQDFGLSKKDSSVFEREVAIKVWSKKPEGWKITYFFSTVNYDQ
jgi:hypothetical protein